MSGLALFKYTPCDLGGKQDNNPTLNQELDKMWFLNMVF